MDWARFVAIVSILAVLVTVASFFTFCPQRLVRLQARLLHHLYKGYLRLSDEQIDKIRPAPGTRELIGSLSQFLQAGAQTPNDFTRFVQYIRTLGYILWSMLLIGTALFLWAIATGKQMYWP